MTDPRGGSTFVLKETRKIPTFPFTMEVEFRVQPPQEGPHDTHFFRKSLETVIQTFWLGQSSRLLEVSQEMERYALLS